MKLGQCMAGVSRAGFARGANGGMLVAMRWSALFTRPPRVPDEVPASDDVGALLAQVGFTFRPRAAHWQITRRASSGRLVIRGAQMLAVVELPGVDEGRAALEARMREAARSRSVSLEYDLRQMRGPLAERAAARHDATRADAAWRSPFAFVSARGFPLSEVGELLVLGDGLVALMLASPTRTSGWG